MSDKKKDKAARGRHAAGAMPVDTPQETSESIDPHETQALPPLVDAEAPTGPAYGAQGFIPATPMAPVEFGQEEAVRSRKPLKILGIVLGVIVGLLLIVYVAGAIYFTGRFMPNTTLGDDDVSLKTAAEVQGMLADAMDDYVVTITGQGFSLKLAAKDAGITVDGQAVTDDMLADVNPWLWPLQVFQEHDGTDRLAASYNESGLDTVVRSAVDEFNATATQPVNATIAFDPDVAAFAVQPEVAGTALNADAVIKAVDDAIVALQSSVKLTSEQLVQPAVLSTNQALVQAAASANKMIGANMQLMMGGSVAGAVTPELIASWIRLGDDLTATLDEGALSAWVDELAAACNTVGTTRTYTRPDGKVVTVSGGVYGWEVDHDALLTMVKDGVANATVATLDVPCVSSGTAYNGAGAQDWGARYCDIDLSEQYVRFYDASGALVWESACISGEPDGEHDTPTGVYWLNSKASPSKLIGYENGVKIYESTVQYWMPFVGNAIGLHDADWQPSFGGTMYADGYGSHGCVNLPPSLAASLYGIIQSGDVVVCHW